MKLTWELAVVLVVVIGATISSTLFVEERFVKQEPTFADHEKKFDEYVAFNERRALEDQLARLQERLAQLLAVPEGQRQQWQREEIVRLQQAIERVRDKIRYG